LLAEVGIQVGEGVSLVVVLATLGTGTYISLRQKEETLGSIVAV
jgi:hypothetical protein